MALWNSYCCSSVVLYELIRLQVVVSAPESVLAFVVFWKWKENEWNDQFLFDSVFFNFLKKVQKFFFDSNGGNKES